MNVGDYVRTKDGLIRKIIEIDKYGIIHVDKDFISSEPEYHRSFVKEEIIKSSPQIIDLIEKNDYVNGRKVFEINITKIAGHYSYLVCEHNYLIQEKDIKAIVTHEQMEAMQYRVEE